MGLPLVAWAFTLWLLQLAPQMPTLRAAYLIGVVPGLATGAATIIAAWEISDNL
jgi:hypothetical protein